MSREKSAKVKKYFELRTEHPEFTKRKCMDLAGYGKNTNPERVEGTVYFQELVTEYQAVCKSLDKDIATRIKEAQKATGACAMNNLKALTKIVNKKVAKDRDIVSATKEITAITGEKMPEQVDHNLSMDEELLSKILSK